MSDSRRYYHFAAERVLLSETGVDDVLVAVTTRLVLGREVGALLVGTACQQHIRGCLADDIGVFEVQDPRLA